MKRKIIKQGNDTLTITLPREWTSSFNIKGGDELDVVIKGRRIILQTEKLLYKEKTTHDSKRFKTILPWTLMTFYRKGYDEVELHYDTPHTLILIQNLLRDDVTGYHITDHTNKSCTLQALSEINDLDFNQMLRKLFLLVKIKLEKISQAIASENIQSLHSVIAMNTMPSRITNFCYRLIAKGNVKNIETVAQLYLIVNKLENLDEQLTNLIEILIKTKQKANSCSSYVNDLSLMFNSFFDAYNAKDIDHMISILNSKNIMQSKLYEYESYNDCKDPSIMMSMNSSLQHFNEILNAGLAIHL